MDDSKEYSLMCETSDLYGTLDIGDYCNYNGQVKLIIEAEWHHDMSCNYWDGKTWITC